ncbi:MAG: hypothetical protein ACM3KL_09605, partial [Alphaproteobacteria bacterium]
RNSFARSRPPISCHVDQSACQAVAWGAKAGKHLRLLSSRLTEDYLRSFASLRMTFASLPLEHWI